VLNLSKPQYQTLSCTGRLMNLIRLSLTIIVLTFAASSSYARHHQSSANSEGQAGQFDYYVLSLSWAPSYCLIHAGDGAECAGKGYGFVVHGLWPQYDAGGYPENCPTQFELSDTTAAKGRSIYPSEHLMQHEWQEHGTCSGLDARTYFDTVDRATAAVRIPAALEAPRSEQSLTAAKISDLFRGANPQIPDHALAVACSRGNLSEVRVCLTRELSVRTCGRGVRTTCPEAAITVPASR
jgi:ribonuclease T2